MLKKRKFQINAKSNKNTSNSIVDRVTHDQHFLFSSSASTKGNYTFSIIRKESLIKSYITSVTYFLKGRNNSTATIKFMKDFAENFYIVSCPNITPVFTKVAG